MSDHEDHRSSDCDPHDHGDGSHGHGNDDHGPAIWRGLMAWLYPILHPNPPSNQLMVDLAEVGPDDRVLDVGCGPGAAVRFAAPLVRDSVGVDPSERMLRSARRRARALPNVRFVQSPAHRLPFEDGGFTVVWTIHSMHHWGDEAAGVSEVRRVLALGGRFLVMELLDPGKPWGVDEEGVERIAQMMRAAGFADVKTTQHPVDSTIEVVIVGHA